MNTLAHIVSVTAYLHLCVLEECSLPLKVNHITPIQFLCTAPQVYGSFRLQWKQALNHPPLPSYLMEQLEPASSTFVIVFIVESCIPFRE